MALVMIERCCLRMMLCQSMREWLLVHKPSWKHLNVSSIYWNRDNFYKYKDWVLHFQRPKRVTHRITQSMTISMTSCNWRTLVGHRWVNFITNWHIQTHGDSKNFLTLSSFFFKSARFMRCSNRFGCHCFIPRLIQKITTFVILLNINKQMKIVSQLQISTVDNGLAIKFNIALGDFSNPTTSSKQCE